MNLAMKGQRVEGDRMSTSYPTLQSIMTSQCEIIHAPIWSMVAMKGKYMCD